MFKRHTLVVKYDCNEGNFEENANITVSYTGTQCVKTCTMEINELAMTSAVKGYSRITRGHSVLGELLSFYILTCQIKPPNRGRVSKFYR